jgi:hypothetical protein
MRAGLHTGEITLKGNRHRRYWCAYRLPGNGSRTRWWNSGFQHREDLTVGSSIRYEPMGPFQLKGVSGEWNLYEVR